ncbi:hypothetical protein D5R81_08010 [Parashewanella spongiae]|uniref:Uncharacterized protein n=1 Tax=Parashewanella spongiae TaxID=342950 RepID=A0A3A6TX39_9GAMM|nr:hypothetical protein D5R81_08010 [Parashewanella spongiae]
MILEDATFRAFTTVHFSRRESAEIMHLQVIPITVINLSLTQQELKGFSARHKLEVLYSLQLPYETGIQRTSCFCRDNSSACNAVMEPFSLALRELVCAHFGL